MLRRTSSEFIMILSLLEIIIPDLCLFSTIILQIKIHKSYSCVCGFFKLGLDQRMCRREFGFTTDLFIFVCINFLCACKKCLYLGASKFHWSKSFACCPEVCLLVIRASGYCWISFECVWLIKRVQIRLI
jgi:hypothetical protein